MRILILSFNYHPDLSPCSFRTTALVRALLERLPETVHVEVITTFPSRYDSFTDHALALEEVPRLTIHRIRVPAHGGGLLAQAKAFVIYARKALAKAGEGRYDVVYGTSSRLMTAALSAYVARRKKRPLYLDIRDIFVDTIKDVLPRGFAVVTHPLFSAIERWTITSAQVVNLVSPGFERYFKHRYPRQRYTFFTNGIDDDFIAVGSARVSGPERDEGQLKVLYAGNIGEGQGLHGILPELALRLAGRVKFVVIGDGGRKRQLERGLARVGCDNVDVVPPMKREMLIEVYRKVDVLFLHLNDYPAFDNVLPSKLFEYAATGKPIWAGIAGYAATFVRSEIDNAAVFPPCNVDQAVQTLDELRLEVVPRTTFVARYARASIMREMAADIGRLMPALG